MLAQEYTDAYLAGDWWENPLLILLIVIAALAGITFFLCHSSVASSSRERAKVASAERKSAVSSEPKEKRRTTLFAMPPTPLPVPETGGKDLRISLRRKGKPVKVFVEGLPGTTEAAVCWVLDRSKGGLSVLVAQAIKVGLHLRVRSANAPDSEPWVSVEVKNCRKRGYRWTVGCCFETELPWSTLLLFG